jgi:hypothetical protein
MNTLNEIQKQYLSEIGQKLSGAMKKINLTRDMSHQEADAIRKELDSVQGALAVFSDINPETKQMELFKATADLSEKVLNVLTDSHDHLV